LGAAVTSWKKNDLVLKADVPEVDMKDMDIQVEKMEPSVKGSGNSKRRRGDRLSRIERSYGSFARSFALPESVDRRM